MDFPVNHPHSQVVDYLELHLILEILVEDYLVPHLGIMVVYLVPLVILKQILVVCLEQLVQLVDFMVQQLIPNQLVGCLGLLAMQPLIMKDCSEQQVQARLNQNHLILRPITKMIQTHGEMVGETMMMMILGELAPNQIHLSPGLGTSTITPMTLIS